MKKIQSTIFSLLGIVVLVLNLNGCAFKLPSQISVHSAKEFVALTTDRVPLKLVRFQSRTLSSNDPVILLVTSPHTNASFWSLDGSVDLPRYLAKRGWDVWAFSFRGTSQSKTREEPLFDDYVTKDLPAVIAAIQKKTGKKKIAALGHGFGATALLSYLEKESDQHISQAVVLAPPAQYLLPLPDFFFLPLESDLVRPLFFNQTNISSDVQSRFSILAEEKMPTALIRLFKTFSETGGLGLDLSSLSAPLLMVSGKKDNFAPTEGLLAIYEIVGSKNKHFREFGSNNFYQINYDHHDLVLSSFAKKEVYPYIFEWLEANKND